MVNSVENLGMRTAVVLPCEKELTTSHLNCEQQLSECKFCNNESTALVKNSTI